MALNFAWMALVVSMGRSLVKISQDLLRMSEPLFICADQLSEFCILLFRICWHFLTCSYFNGILRATLNPTLC